MELDHVFIFVKGPKCAQPLKNLGLVAGMSRTHTGQGTANLVFLFENAYLELIWLEEQPTFADARRTAIEQRGRWWESGANRFGVCWRGDGTGLNSPWSYKPPYFPPEREILMDARSQDISLPLLFCLPDSQPPEQFTPRALLQKKYSRIERVQIDGPTESSELPWSFQVNWCRTEVPQMQIWLSGPSAGQSQSIQAPDLPLLLHGLVGP